MPIELARGVRDFPPEEKIIRDAVIGRIKTVFEKYGYAPLETPIIERYETLSAKFGAGMESDALKETFRLKDQGGRDLALRFDLTVPLARYVAMHPTLKMPFKRYQIGNVYRDGPIKLGRYREFLQCDVDIVGCKAVTAEAELILLTLEVYRALGLEAILLVNSRKLLQGILDLFEIKPKLHNEAITILDKIDKIGMAGVETDLAELGIEKKTTKKITDLLDIRGTNKKILEQLKKKIDNEHGKEGIEELEELFSILGDQKDVKLDISLARGLSYYTGIVFEGYATKSKIKSSICGGGRYDDMIGSYAGGKKDLPAVGISFGIEPIIEALKLKGIKQLKSVAQIYVVPINTFPQCLEIVQDLRHAGLRADIDLMGKSISKNLDYANALGIPYTLIVGEEEIRQNLPKLKNMKTGKEEHMTLAAVKAKLLK